jgi:GGDEF domain-containing protein
MAQIANVTPTLTALTDPAAELCECQALSLLNRGREERVGEEYLPVTPVTPELGSYLRVALATYFPRSSPISVLLLHISQLEHVHISPKSAMLHRRHRFHAPQSFLEQVLANVRRTIRGSDPVITHGGTGAAIIFPEVDQEGAFNILERAYHSINLLQPETVIPPLSRETDIFLGMGSYPEPAKTLEELFYQTGCVAHRLTLRPAVVSAHIYPYTAGQSHEMSEQAETSATAAETGKPHSPGRVLDQIPPAGSSGIPFMQLPTKLPARLKNLIPYRLARELHCAPVGRDHNRLSVAMAQPADIHALGALKAATGMLIYPVACEISALDVLLANEW